MRLSQIKLSGFKSFVEPTTFSFPSNRIGIVGPNGCGKSNIIDAVRWVMGESSAKHLRGAAMSDVIFNGAQNRQPVEQAVIELIFEQVELPQYPAEIAVKRQLTRAGHSHYFLNGVRCRRKDITDLFLGTGLGPRSYAIIEQGMVSRLIEAKPEEVRLLLEEAAGISKYKERRKETEQRIRQTQDNLARLNEVRQELEQQLQKLHKQVKLAEKYQQLKQDEQLLKAQLLALRWHELNLSVQEQQQSIDERAAVLQTTLLKQHELDTTHQDQHQARQQAQEQLEAAQDHFYELDTQIQRLEHELQNHQDRHEQWHWELQQLEQRFERIQHQLLTGQQQFDEQATTLETLTTQLSRRQHEEHLAEQQLHHQEQELEAWQTNWDRFNEQAAEPTQRAQVARAQIQGLEEQLEYHYQRCQQLQTTLEHLDLTQLEQGLTQLENQVAEQQTALETVEQDYEHYQSQVQQLQELIHQHNQQLHQQQGQLHQLNGRLSALVALQEAAVKQDDPQLQAWLKAQGLTEAPQLRQILHVEAGWEQAVEMVLAHWLAAVCVADIETVQSALQQPPGGQLTLLECHTPATPATPNSLATKIQAPQSLTALFHTIHCAETFEQAYQLRQQLSLEESVITPQGLWLGHHWVRSHQATDSSILAREQAIQALTTELEALEQQVEQLTQSLETQRAQWQQQEHYRLNAQQQVNAIQKHYAQLQAQYSNQHNRLEHAHAQQQQLTQEYQSLTIQIQEQQQRLSTQRQQLHADLGLMEQLAQQREQLTQQRQLVQEQVTQARQTWQTAKDERYQLTVQLESLRRDQTYQQQELNRWQAQLEQLTEQRYTLTEKLAQQQHPLETLQEQLEQHHEQRSHVQEKLHQAKQTLSHLEHRLGHYQTERQQLEQHSQTLRSELEQARMACQADTIRQQNLEEQLTQNHYSPVALVAELPEYADESSWQAHIEAVERKIERIGAVNLAALEEFNSQSERKQYLDQQGDDLTHALELLDNAIRTIDRETRLRFQKTLEQLNSQLQQMFPRLFGGGHAYLQLTDADILTAGVTIMAQPPGKRNTHIHLLSGGEKALTAIALIFAIFELNPAPFCMLDEVDAPLDDTNVGRFCTLVKMMSERVQFIFISHNKITMEIADQLLGVTMQEAGVSRLVSVDIDKAIDMISV